MLPPRRAKAEVRQPAQVAGRAGREFVEVRLPHRLIETAAMAAADGDQMMGLELTAARGDHR